MRDRAISITHRLDAAAKLLRIYPHDWDRPSLKYLLPEFPSEHHCTEHRGSGSDGPGEGETTETNSERENPRAGRQLHLRLLMLALAPGMDPVHEVHRMEVAFRLRSFAESAISGGSSMGSSNWRCSSSSARRFASKREVENIGLNIPPPTLGQSTNDYRREMMRLMKRTFLPQTHDLSRVNMRGLPDAALAGIEQALIPAVKVAAFDPMTVPRGQFREIVQTDANGLKTRCFIGQDHFTKFMGRPGRLAKFRPLSIHDYK